MHSCKIPFYLFSVLLFGFSHKSSLVGRCFAICNKNYKLLRWYLMVWCIFFFPIFSAFFCAVHLLVIHRNVGCDISPWILNKSDEGIPATFNCKFFPFDVAWVRRTALFNRLLNSLLRSIVDKIAICFHPLLLGVHQLSHREKN